jgi:hypothetical protein
MHMNKNIILTVAVFFLCIAMAQAKPTQKPAVNPPLAPSPQFKPSKPLCFDLTDIEIADTSPKKYVWVFHNVNDPSNYFLGSGKVYSSLEAPALHKWLSRLPPGSIISYNFITSDTLLPDNTLQHPHLDYKRMSPTLQSKLDGFKKFCNSKKLLFSITVITY